MNQFFIFFVLLLTGSLSLGAAKSVDRDLFVNSSAGRTKPLTVSGAFLVKFKGTSEKSRRALTSALKAEPGLFFREEVELGTQRILRIDASAEALANIKKRNDVEWIEPVVKARLLNQQPVKPNDVLYSMQYAHIVTGLNLAWNTQTKSDALLIILDTGVDAGHPDLLGNLLPGRNFIDDLKSEDDDVFHGTHVAGIIGAVGNNSVGVAGGAWKTDMVSFKVCAEDGCPMDAIIKALKAAADLYPERRKVVNMSLGISLWSQAMAEAVAYARAHDVVIVAAAGNDGSHGSFNYPSSLPGVLSVGAHDEKGELPYWTNWGPSHVPVSAPGANIVSTIPRSLLTNPVKYVDPIGGEPYAALDGTSMASPYAAMLAGFVRTFWPKASESQVWDVMVQGADIPTLPIAPELQHHRVNAEKIFDLAQTQKTFKQTNYSVARAFVKINSFRYYYFPRILSLTVEAQDRGAPETYIRWFVQYDGSAREPVGTQRVQTCPLRSPRYSSQTWRGDCGPQKRVIHLPIDLFPLLWNPDIPSLKLSAFIEDRDDQGRIVELVPVEFDDGSTQAEMTPSTYFQSIYGFLNNINIDMAGTIRAEGWAFNTADGVRNTATVELTLRESGVPLEIQPAVIASLKAEESRPDFKERFFIWPDADEDNHGFHFEIDQQKLGTSMEEGKDYILDVSILQDPSIIGNGKDHVALLGPDELSHPVLECSKVAGQVQCEGTGPVRYR